MDAPPTTDVPVVSTPRRRPPFPVVDAQFHLRGEPDLAVAAMDAVGVETAVVDVWPPDTRTGSDGILVYDFTLVEAAAARYPGRFGYVGRVDPADPALDDRMAAFAASPHVRCVRITDPAGLDRGIHRAVLAAAGRHAMPVMLLAADRHDAALRYIREFDDVQFVIDHVGMEVSVLVAMGAERPPPSVYVDRLLAYAPFPNVAVKWGHAPRLSFEEYPFADVDEQLARAAEAFGPARIMWASDYTVVRDHHTYAESMFSLRDSDLLDAEAKTWILGRSARALLRWPSGAGAVPRAAG
jgi:predicted TIM-barrel fold metal-dependent hydrolase